jgi:hypothetical protein
MKVQEVLDLMKADSKVSNLFWELKITQDNVVVGYGYNSIYNRNLNYTSMNLKELRVMWMKKQKIAIEFNGNFDYKKPFDIQHEEIEPSCSIIKFPKFNVLKFDKVS